MNLTRTLVFLLLAVVFSATVLYGQSDFVPMRRIDDENLAPLKNWRVDFERFRISLAEDSTIVPTAVPSAASHFITLNPCRILDTRGFGFTGQYGPPALAASESRNFTIGGQCGIPASASAVSFNFTVAEMGSGGNLKVFPAGAAPPTVSTLNWTGNTFVIANGAIVPLGAGAAITVANESTTSTHLILDANGYFAEGVVTSLTAGAGLVGGGTGAVTLGIASGGVGAAQLGAGSVTSEKIAEGAVTETKIAAGAAIPGRPVFARSTIDSAGNVGLHTSVAIGSDGLGLISYYDATTADLNVAHCSNLACTASTVTTLDSNGDVGRYSSVAIGQDGFGLISYYDATNGDLKVAHCSNLACSSATTNAVDSTAGIVGEYSSIAIGQDGFGLISYYDATNVDLKVAHCANIACTTAASVAIDLAGGQHTSIAIGSDGLGAISYYASNVLKFAHCTNVVCNGGSVSFVDASADVGQYTSITIGNNGLALISYYDVTNANLKVVTCSSQTTCVGSLIAQETLGNVGLYTSITIGSDGREMVTYYDATNGDLKVLHAGYTAIIDDAGLVGEYTSVTIGSDGFALVSYRDATSADLKVAHLSNVFGVPHYRRR